jgi:ADP-ribose pyrophosphatase YjhB (NUDIX family)
MTSLQTPRWLQWAQEIQALAQTGYHYAENHYQQERNQRLMEIAAEIVSEHSDLGYEATLAIYRAQAGYATPRVDVRAAVFRDGKLLLVRELSDGGWTMPGGWADVGDMPSRAAEREAWEEAGFRVKACKFVGVYDNNRIQPLQLFHCFKLVFLCDLLSGEASPSLETAEVAFFGLDEIPQPLSGQRTALRHIQDAFTAYLNPSCPAVFD